jgi:branched-chain amino acid transport system ATP-binding protein
MYGPICALRDVTIEVAPDTIVALIGPNGAGKSTLLGAILGLVRPSAGTIEFLSHGIAHSPTDRIVASGIAIAPEGRGVFSQMTVQENLQLGAHHIRRDRSSFLHEAYDRFPILAERAAQQAGTLSGGEQQMLSIARALVSHPRLLLLDEPSLGLAPVIVQKLFESIVALKRGGPAILVAEQNAAQALRSSDQAYVFETGRVVLSGVSSTLRSDPRVRGAYLAIGEDGSTKQGG